MQHPRRLRTSPTLQSQPKISHPIDLGCLSHVLAKATYLAVFLKPLADQCSKQVMAASTPRLRHLYRTQGHLLFHMHLTIRYVMMAAATNNLQSVLSMHLNVYEHEVFTDV